MNSFFESEIKKFVSVILPLSLPNLYTYAVPTELEKFISIGKRVEVQFGKKKIYAGIINSISNFAPEGVEIKFISNVLDEQPVVNESQINLWKWMSEYYCCNIGDVMNAALPAALKLESESKIIIHPDFKNDYTYLNDKEYLIAEALSIQSELSIQEVAQLLHVKSAYAVIVSLIKKNVIILKEELVQQYRPRKEWFVSLHEKYKLDEVLKELLDSLEKKPQQQNLILAFLQLTHPFKTNQGTSIKRKTLLDKSQVSASVLDTLCKNGILFKEERLADRLSSDEIIQLKTFKLSDSQSIAFTEIKNNFNSYQTVLLEGVTSSGKTNIYIKLIEEYLKAGKQVLYMLPEIALTTQITERLKNYFGDICGIYHSKFNQQERVEIWKKTLSKEYQLVLGARSSLLLPFENLGLIIIDEEHDSSYKQDRTPRYQARDTAIAYAAQLKAKVLLGTATPSLETEFNCSLNKFARVKLTHRYGNILLPELQFVNMKDEKRLKLSNGNYSSVLLEELKRTLEAKEQAILFQNRRGYAPYIECDTCNHIPYCPNCDVSLTLHKFHHELKCHYCNYRQDIYSKCPSCGGSHILEKGFGTEKIEDEIKILFPEARIARMDMDTVRTKHGHNKMITEIQDGNIDILVGTQMVTKGLDFDKVSMVGVLSADQILQYPDFRSNERAFQLIKQVSGRAGRRNKQGKVIIQTFNINHPVIRFLMYDETEKFYEWEMEQRKKLLFPPYVRLINITLKYKDSNVLREASNFASDYLKSILNNRVNGPIEPLVNKVRNEFLFEILLKLEKNTSMIKQAREAISIMKEKLWQEKSFRTIQVEIDVDPY